MVAAAITCTADPCSLEDCPVMTDSASNASRITRRDFLATVSLLPFATSWIPRTAFAQNARNSGPADTVVTVWRSTLRFGVSRIGNSKEWFLAPEDAGGCRLSPTGSIRMAHSK